LACYNGTIFALSVTKCTADWYRYRFIGL